MTPFLSCERFPELIQCCKVCQTPREQTQLNDSGYCQIHWEAINVNYRTPQERGQAFRNEVDKRRKKAKTSNEPQPVPRLHWCYTRNNWFLMDDIKSIMPSGEFSYDQTRLTKLNKHLTTDSGRLYWRSMGKCFEIRSVVHRASVANEVCTRIGDSVAVIGEYPTWADDQDIEFVFIADVEPTK